MNWRDEEFKTRELAEARWKRGAVLLAERRGQKSPKAMTCQSGAEVAAAYLLRDKEVHWDKAVGTALDDRSQAITGLEPLNCEARLKSALATHKGVAWRLDRPVRLERTLPEPDADLVSERDEWRAAFILSRKFSEAESCV